LSLEPINHDDILKFHNEINQFKSSFKEIIKENQ